MDYLVAGKTDKFFNNLNTLATNGKRYEDIVDFLKYQVKEIIFVKKGLTKNINQYKLKIIKEKTYPISKLFQILNILVKVGTQITGYTNPKEISELAFLQILLSVKWNHTLKLN